MGDHVLAGTPPVCLTLRRSPRARRISLRISGLDGRVTLTVPRGVTESAALDFARSRGDWLRTQLAGRPVSEPVRPGSDIPLEGQFVRIASGAGRGLRVEGGHLLVPGAPEMAAVRIEAWLRAQARDRLAAAADRHAATLGRRYTRLTLRDTRSRWGSCAISGALSFSWRLIMAPPEVLDYVAAHEVAHLAEMNHSPAFWNVVGGLLPGYAAPRAWLRREGAALHRYRFRD